MADKKQRNDVRQMRFLLGRIAELAEHAENTGTFEGGAQMSARRYNRIIDAMEEQEILPQDIFPRLEDSVSFSTLGAEARLLKEYLDEYGNGDEEEGVDAERDRDRDRGRRRRDRDRDRDRGQGEGTPDLGLITAIAPFMEQKDLSRLVSRHFPNNNPDVNNSAAPDTSLPGLQEIVDLAPFVERATLQALVEAYIARGGRVESKKIVELAPFLPRDFFGQLLQQNFPRWFSTEPVEPSSSPTSEERQGFIFTTKAPADDSDAS